MEKRQILLPQVLTGATILTELGFRPVWWSTETPAGAGTLHLERTTPSLATGKAWGPGACWLLEQAPRFLGSEDDLAGFEPTGLVKKLWRKKPFLLGRTDRIWDKLVESVLGQKVQVTKAKRSEYQIARKFGQPAPGPTKNWILPSPETVARLGYFEFQTCGVERKRAEILIRSAHEMPRLKQLTELDPAQARSRLERISGIGRWTSALVTAAAMGDSDAVPVGDFHIPNMVSWGLAGQPRGTDDRMLELLQPFSGHRWRVIRLLKGSLQAPKYGPRLSLTDDGLHLGA